MSEELKPCPFCGGDSSKLTAEPIGVYLYVVFCNWLGCEAKGPEAESLEKAVIAWNKRAEGKGDE